MALYRKLLVAALCISFSTVSNAQLEVAHLSMRTFKATGLEAFLM